MRTREPTFSVSSRDRLTGNENASFALQNCIQTTKPMNDTHITCSVNAAAHTSSPFLHCSKVSAYLDPIQQELSKEHKIHHAS